MLSDIAEWNPDNPKRLDIRLHDLFERDLKNILNTLEKLCHGKANHADYVMAYDYFVGIWGPEADQLKRIPHSIGEEVMCKCGKTSGSAFIGRESYVARCNDCMGYKELEHQLVYVEPPK